MTKCRDPFTGESVIDHFEHPNNPDPRTLNGSESDIVVVWKGFSSVFEHPNLGRIGPVPFRRTGGHTGRFGLAYIRHAQVVTGDQGIRNSFDIVPTLIDLLDETALPGLSGVSLMPPASDSLAGYTDLA